MIDIRGDGARVIEQGEANALDPDGVGECVAALDQVDAILRREVGGGAVGGAVGNLGGATLKNAREGLERGNLITAGASVLTGTAKVGAGLVTTTAKVKST